MQPSLIPAYAPLPYKTSIYCLNSASRSIRWYAVDMTPVAHPVPAAMPGPERIAELAGILDEDGYLAEHEPLPDGGYRVVEHNCAVLEVARRYGQACASELEFIRQALPEADVERVAHMMAGAFVCA